MMLTTRKLDRSYPHHPRFRKRLCGLRFDFGSNCSKCCLWLGFTQPWPSCHVSWLTFWPSQSTCWSSRDFDSCWILLKVYLLVSNWLVPKYSEETIYQAAAAFEATTDYHKQQPVILEVTTNELWNSHWTWSPRWAQHQFKIFSPTLPTLEMTKCQHQCDWLVFPRSSASSEQRCCRCRYQGCLALNMDIHKDALWPQELLLPW